MKNILFILADCLRADHVFGSRRAVPTPTLERMKEYGVSFKQTISSATMTSPCVSSFFTGYYPLMTGVHALRGDVLNPKLPTLAERLTERGYRTGALVTGPLWEGLGLERGFEKYEYRKPIPQLSESWRDAIRDFADVKDPRPWFLYAHFFDLHVPRVVAPDLDRMEYGATIYDRALASFDRRLGEVLQYIQSDKTIAIFHADHGELIPPTRRMEIREQIWQDYILGKKPPFMRIGIHRDPTVTLWTRLKRATKMGHGFNLSEGLVRVPLIITGIDAAPQGHVVANQVRQVDIMPTILELAGIDPAPNQSGRSLLPLLRNGESGTRPAYIEARAFGRDPNFFMQGVRTPEWKYVDSPTDNRVKPQLYSLSDGQIENRNLIERYPEVAVEMKRLMDRETASAHSPDESEGWSHDEAVIVEDRLRDLGYF